jgi:hypothetical protein
MVALTLQRLRCVCCVVFMTVRGLCVLSGTRYDIAGLDERAKEDFDGIEQSYDTGTSLSSLVLGFALVLTLRSVAHPAIRDGR